MRSFDETHAGKMKRKYKETEEVINMEWLRVNRPDKWRKIQRMKLEREHEKRKKERTNGNTI